MRWVVFILLAVGVAHAGPTVEIRAQTQLTHRRAKLLDATTVEVSGGLHDKLTGEGLPNQRVTITVGNETRTVTTAADGSFSVQMPGVPGPQQISYEYAGSSRLEKAIPLNLTADPGKAQLALSIVKVGDDPKGALLKVTGTDDDGAVNVPVQIEIAPVGNDDFKPVHGAETNKDFPLTREQVGGAGVHRVRASFPGDEFHQKATATVTIELASATTTSMTLSSTKLAFEDDLVATGTVLDDDKRPVARAAVTLVSGDRRLAQGATNEEGRYIFEVEAEIIGQGQFGIQVQAEPGKPFIKASRSNPEIVRVAAPQPVPVSYTIAAFIATVLAAGAFFAARTKPWRKLRRPAPPAEVPSEEGDQIEQVAGGLVVAKPGIVSTLRRAHDDGFSGVVRDTVRGRPVEDAVVLLVFGDQERSTRSGADGAFALEKLAQGEWRAEVAAPGHVTEKFIVTIPHRGELRGVRVDLVPVRERVFQLYRRAAEPALPESRLWGIWSPRQIVDHVRSKRPSPALADLTDFVEEIYFSPRLAGEQVLPQAAERVDRAVHERAARR